MFSSEAVDELVGRAQHSALHLCMHGFISLTGGQSRDLFPSGLDEGVETVSAGLEPLLEEFELSLVALFLGNGGH